MREYQVPPIPQSVWQNPYHFVAFGFGSGTLPIAPGTFGTLFAIPIYLALQLTPLWFYLLILFLITIGSIWLCDKVSRELQIHDHQGMCLDEFVGYLVTMVGAPSGIQWILIGFLLFRFFDIVKPPPIRFIDEKFTGGFGMILDDVLAGIYSCILLHFLAKVFQ